VVAEQAYYPRMAANRWLAMRLELIGNFSIFAAAVFAIEASQDTKAGDVGFSLTYAMGVTQVLNWMVRMATELETSIVAVERVDEYTKDIPEERPDRLAPVVGDALLFSHPHCGSFAFVRRPLIWQGFSWVVGPIVYSLAFLRSVVGRSWRSFALL
jgi:ABC-type multidrug transport system fused ATPase/permease subunit